MTESVDVRAPQYLSFTIRGTDYGLPILTVKEILQHDWEAAVQYYSRALAAMGPSGKLRADRGIAEAERPLDRAVRRVPRSSRVGDEPDGPVPTGADGQRV